jgi:LytS/YehU family sensor histidine kinase
MKSVVNILPEVATDKERKAFIDLCSKEEDADLRIKIENKGIRKEPEFRIAGDQRDYEKLDLKVELLLHHLRTDL